MYTLYVLLYIFWICSWVSRNAGWRIPVQQERVAAWLRCRAQRPTRRSDVKQRTTKKRQAEQKHLHTDSMHVSTWPVRTPEWPVRQVPDVLAMFHSHSTHLCMNLKMKIHKINEQPIQIIPWWPQGSPSVCSLVTGSLLHMWLGEEEESLCFFVN